MTSLSWDRYRGHASDYDVTHLGYNYRVTEITSALGRVQLKKLKANNRRRALIAAEYRKRLKGLEGVTVPFSRPRGKPSHHIFPVIVDSPARRDALRIRLGKAGIQTSLHYPPVHLFELYRARSPVSLPVTEEVSGRELTLPLYAGLSVRQVGRVTEIMEKFLR